MIVVIKWLLLRVHFRILISGFLMLKIRFDLQPYTWNGRAWNINQSTYYINSKNMISFFFMLCVNDLPHFTNHASELHSEVSLFFICASAMVKNSWVQMEWVWADGWRERGRREGTGAREREKEWNKKSWSFSDVSSRSLNETEPLIAN